MVLNASIHQALAPFVPVKRAKKEWRRRAFFSPLPIQFVVNVMTNQEEGREGDGERTKGRTASCSIPRGRRTFVTLNQRNNLCPRLAERRRKKNAFAPGQRSEGTKWMMEIQF